jgi:hypothetical protein
VLLCSVKRFAEKPDRETAEALLECGALWNTFVFGSSTQALLDLERERLPLLHERLEGLDRFLGTEHERWAIAQAYEFAPWSKTSISRNAALRARERSRARRAQSRGEKLPFGNADSWAPAIQYRSLMDADRIGRAGEGGHEVPGPRPCDQLRGHGDDEEVSRHGHGQDDRERSEGSLELLAPTMAPAAEGAFQCLLRRSGHHVSAYTPGPGARAFP